MPWNAAGIAYTRQNILNSAPSASGVYAIWNKDRWIYIGETNDLQRRLLEHIDGGNACITGQAPTAFSFELVQTEAARIARQNALILELGPACNQMLG